MSFARKSIVKARVKLGDRVMGWLVALALIAYPSGFRRRFGDELREDSWRVFETTGVRGALVHIGSLVVSGLAERGTALQQVLGSAPLDRTRYAPRAGSRDALVLDVRYALRFARRAPLVTTLAVVTLALGIGATTAVYSAIDAAFFRPLPFDDPGQLVKVNGIPVPYDLGDYRPVSGGPTTTKRGLDLTDLGAMRDVFSHGAAYAAGSMNLGSGEQPLRVDLTFVTTEFFDVLRARAGFGRVFTFDETRAGGPRVAILSDRLWRHHFASDADIVGTTVLLNDVPYEVVGVMPDDFRFPASAQLWVPLQVPVPLSLIGEAFRNFLPSVAIARLAPGVTADAARERLDAARQPYLPDDPAARRSVTPVADLVVPLHRWLAGDRGTALAVLLASAMLVLLVACANVATLLLSAAALRQREMATHVVFGATRARLLRRLVTEGLLLALVGAVAGVAVAGGALSLLEALMPPQLTGVAPMRIDLRVLGFAIVVAVATALACSLWPALTSSRVEPGRALAGAGGRSVAASARLTRVLVVAEVGLACLLVMGAGLLLTSLRSLLTTDVGLRPERVVTARLNLPAARYEGRGPAVAFIEDTLARLRDMPGVESGAAINTLPLAREPGTVWRLEAGDGRTDAASAGEFVGAPFLVVSPGYFRTLSIPVLAGRDIAWTDTHTRPVAVINRAAAIALWPDDDPLGKSLTFGGQARTVVGVVGNVRISDLSAEATPQVYLPIQDQPQSYLAFVARGTPGSRPGSILPRLREAVEGVDPSLPLHAAMPMEDVIGALVAPRRVNTLLIGVFAALAVCLAVIGVYGVLAHATAQRTREIGIRMALGAAPGHVRAAVVRQGLVLVALGTVAGIAAAMATTPLIKSLLYEVAPQDPATIGAVVVLFAVVAAVASYLPARRASAVDPLDALRHD